MPLSPAGAQTFTQQLQTSKAGEGTVTLHQDAAIDALVNAPKTPTPPARKPADPKAPAKDAKDPKAADPKAPEPKDKPGAVTDTVDTGRKVMRGQKVTGYRVQVFAGGNSRVDKARAERTRTELKAVFPGEPIYVHFYSPRWICRMGNYRTYEEAHQMLQEVKRMGFESATIIRGKITVPY